MHSQDPIEPHQPMEDRPELNSTGEQAESRYDKMRNWANGQASPFHAAIGYYAADIGEMSGDLADSIKSALRVNPYAVSESYGVAENMRVYLQLVRQAERCIKMVPREPQAKNRSVDTYAKRTQTERQGPLADLDNETHYPGTPK